MTGLLALGAVITWMRDRRHDFDLRQVALRGGMGVVATMAFEATEDDLIGAQGFWDTARYLLATYGAYEAYQLVRFNLDAMRLAGRALGDVEEYDGEVHRLRRNSRMLLQHDMFDVGWAGPFEQGISIPFPVSGAAGLRALLLVMAMALLFQRLGLRRRLNNFPLQAIGVAALANELPVTRNRR